MGYKNKIKKNSIFIFFFSIIIIILIFLFFQKNNLKTENNTNSNVSENIETENKIEDKKELKEYKIKGIDISKYQGDVDFRKVKNDGIFFVFTKATEGYDLKDKYLDINIKKAREEELKIGAYHFFRLCEDGEMQADFFMQNVKKEYLDLPPAVDLELYRNCRSQNGIDFEINQFKKFLNKLENHYKKKIIIYTTVDTFHEYQEEFFDKIDLSDYYFWFRITDRHIEGGDYNNIFGIENETEIRKIMENNWTIWQACDTCRVDGIDGNVDINYFRYEENFLSFDY